MSSDPQNPSLARASSNGRNYVRNWTPDGLQRLRESALRNQPWRHSTGPRTAAGKARSARNSLKHGKYTRERIRAQRLIHGQLRLIRSAIMADRGQMTLEHQVAAAMTGRPREQRDFLCAAVEAEAANRLIAMGLERMERAARQLKRWNDPSGVAEFICST